MGKAIGIDRGYAITGDNVPLVLKVFDAAGRVADTNLPQLVGVP
jgi:hypothetical protein